jgi:LmbE family N-acetylglucosaminyl deacetylase
VLRSLGHRLGFHPRGLLDSLLTYPRFLGRIKPMLLQGQEDEIKARFAALGHCLEVSHLTVPVGRRIVVLAPHPDDESIGAGGLLLAHRGRSEIHLVNVFNGEGGGQLPNHPWSADPAYRDSLVQARRQELAAVAETVGAASIHHLDLRDGASQPTLGDARRLADLMARLHPDVVVLPWYLDNQWDHRTTNVLYAWACSQLDVMVLGYEIWSICQPNSVLDITPWIEEKLALVRLYQTQQTIDYAGYVQGIALVRAFQHTVRPDRSGAAEAYFALPNRDYCDLVLALYGKPGPLSSASRAIP